MTDSAPSSQLSLTDPFVRSLACAAISPGLRSILAFDTSAAALRRTAQILAQMLAVVAGYPVDSVTLGTFESEDDLWGSLGLGVASEAQPFQWKSGLLSAGQQDSQLRLVVIPDLTKLSLAAARACVVLMGADVTHLERHGQQAHWQPNLCWLAGCASSEVGMVSPHLLDRFALRLSGRVTNSTDRTVEILSWIDRQISQEETKSEPLPTEICDRLRQATQHRVAIADKAKARILDYISTLEVYSPRREIALARLAVAYARLEGVAEVTVDRVDTAARMMGLKPVAKPIEAPSNPTPDPVTPPPELPKPTETKPTSTPSLPKQSEPSTVREPIYESDRSELLPPTPLTVPGNPYPEDEAPVEREAASLRLPPRRFRASAANRGPIIGVEKARTLQDLALVRTILEAAKFQPIRQQTQNGQRRLKLSATDLHCYRRSPIAEQMLMVVLDHTCLRDCNWQEELLPYLSWAYVERASVCLIQVGAADAKHELQAERVMAESILVPRINAGMEAGRGKATPLAHGLDLALQTLRHALQHGRSTSQQAVLVVISDGRGNVPLEASRLGRIVPPVGRKGVEDALQVAECIGGLDGVKAVLLNPQPKQYADLPSKLAEALGASVVAIPPLEAVEVG